MKLSRKFWNYIANLTNRKEIRNESYDKKSKTSIGKQET